MKTHALIVAGGLPPSRELLKSEIARADIIIAADSGAEALKGVDISALTLVGDFDSIAPETLEVLRQKKAQVLKSDTHKDETDTLLAMDAAIVRGAKTVTVLGALGKRLDHAYANIALLLYAKKRGIKAELKDDEAWIFLLDRETKFSVKPHANVSVFSVTKRCVFSASEGLEYPLDHLTIYRSKPIGVSNVAVKSQICIRKTSGTALVIVS